MYGPRTCEISSARGIECGQAHASNVTGSNNRRDNPKRCPNSPVKERSFKLCSGISSVDLSGSLGMAASNRMSCRGLGFEVRIQNSWDVVGVVR